MKLLYFSVFILYFFSPSQAQFYYEYFDNNANNFGPITITIDSISNKVWQIGPPQKSIFNSASTVPNVIVTDTITYYPTGISSSFIVTVENQGFNWGIFAFEWVQKLDLDSGFDGGIIEYSIDSGATWVNVFNDPYVYNFYGFDISNTDTLTNGEYAFSGTDSTWKNIWLCFDYSWMEQFETLDLIMFRFTIKSDEYDNQKEGWMIDNMFAHLTGIHTVGEVEQEEYMSIYPNPTADKLNIQIKKVMEYHLIEQMELIDSRGVTVDKWTKVPTKFWIDTDKYPGGNYFLKIQTNFKTEIHPIIIQKKG